jgi:phosphopantothenoylcysteine decarboxylase/phosphopantothenate--cysteine ligase
MNVLLGVTGSIAAYKSLELARLLRRHGAEVRFILTKSALNFITPLSCQTLSNNEVYFDQFVLSKGIKHLTLGEWGDIFVIAPATANVIGKAACGIADDLLSTTMISCQKSMLFVPAMDQGMWDNRVVQENVATLKKNGVHFLEPSVGTLATGKTGRGRFPEASIILKKILTVHEKRGGLAGKRFLVTGGRTEEDLDPVRVVTNRSSGLMGAELVQAVYCREGRVKGIFGEVACLLPEDVELTRVRTSVEMLRALKKDFDWCDCLIMAAAIGDYKPRRKNVTKKHDKAYKVDLEKNVDLLKELAKQKGNKLVVGFSLEDKNVLARARDKKRAKNLDMVVLNSSAAIGQDSIKASILRQKGNVVSLEEQTKWQLANRVLDECMAELGRYKERH